MWDRSLEHDQGIPNANPVRNYSGVNSNPQLTVLTRVDVNSLPLRARQSVHIPGSESGYDTKARGSTGKYQPLPRWRKDYGTGPRGHEIDLPDGGLFNIHLAIAKVVYTSGAGEVISKILQDEEDFNEGTVKDEASAVRISAFAVRMALQEMQADDSAESASDCDDDNSGNKHQEHDRGVLRVSTNSQRDGQ
ncbi:hypothetical protein V1527DRAFT_460494 [Lipomyces starkeyi]